MTEEVANGLSKWAPSWGEGGGERVAWATAAMDLVVGGEGRVGPAKGVRGWAGEAKGDSEMGETDLVVAGGVKETAEEEAGAASAEEGVA